MVLTLDGRESNVTPPASRLYNEPMAPSVTCDTIKAGGEVMVLTQDGSHYSTCL